MIRYKQYLLKLLKVIIDKTPTHALFIQHYISLACWFHCTTRNTTHTCYMYCCHNAGVDRRDFKFSVL